jgi:outer membrane receptor protein involved in Fe transport
MPDRLTTLLALSLVAGPAVTGAQTKDLEEVVIVAPYGAAVDRDRVATRVQQADSSDVKSLQPLDLGDFLDRRFGSVSINQAQNNPLQPDVNYRGFTASPLLGMAQGIAVYVNGVRTNEPFGDTVNWDLIPVSAIQTVQLGGGPQPMFGENALGGALVLRYKDGFTSPGGSGEVYGGSFGRHGAVFEAGKNEGIWGLYGNVDYLAEDGWREHSDSEALRAYGSLAIEGEQGSFETSVLLGRTRLRGNGAAPVELLEQDRRAVFTWPDETENETMQLTLQGERRLAADWRLAANVFWRRVDSDSFNGDATPFETCNAAVPFLSEQDCDDEDAAPLLDAYGEPLPATLDDAELNAINNLSLRTQQATGASLQIARDTKWRDALRNSFVAGVSFSRGDTAFDSNVELASLREDRSTTRSGLFAWDLRTRLDSINQISSAWIADTLDLTAQLSLSLAARYDMNRVTLEDRTGVNPELDGAHEFSSFNPSVGMTWRPTENLQAYISAGRTARAPTPVELACASEDAPCNLPNAFLADPPLEKVVADSLEAGMRGQWGEQTEWHAGMFRVVNRDDILFQATGGAQANVGFFQNIADTRRQGLEAGVQRNGGPFSWYVEYSLIDATFEDSFTESSPNHPDAEEGLIGVPRGARIPGIPRHLFNAGGSYSVARWQFGLDVNARDGVYLRGDEANQLARTDGYWVANVRAEFRLNDSLEFFAHIENLFDSGYETFGLLGEPDEVFEEFDDPRFLGSGPPFGFWIGARLHL